MENNIVRSLLEWFLSDIAKEDRQAEAYLRGVIIVGVILMSSLFAALLCVGLLYSPYPENPADKRIAVAIAALTLLCYLASLLHYKLTHRLVAASNGYAIGVLVATSLPGFITGGMLYSPNMQIIIVIPVWAFLMAGRHYGLLWAGIVTAVLVAYFIGEQQGVVFHQVIPDEYLLRVKLATWLVALNLVVICLVVYEVNFSMLTDRLTKERSKFAYEAGHDSLTGLSNRKLFRSRVEDAINFSLDENSMAAIVYIDLDEFKPINDQFGHPMGDEVLKVVAQRLKEGVRASDSVARLGGDEFGVVLYGIKDEGVAASISDKLLFALREPIVVGDHEFRIGASLGVTIVPDEGSQTDAVILSADRAMYSAKTQRNRVCYSAPNLNRTFAG